MPSLQSLSTPKIQQLTFPFFSTLECLEQHTSHRSSYLCAPNDVWSLGVILVNLTCGRNPWKQASVEDSTYRAFTRNPEFLKTILPVSDELNDILGRIFTRDPARRITMPELVEAIRTCPRFTCPTPLPQEALASPAPSSRTYVSESWIDPIPAVSGVETIIAGPLPPLNTYSPNTSYCSPATPPSDYSSDDDDTASIFSASSAHTTGSQDGLDRSDVDMNDANGCQVKVSPVLNQAPVHFPYQPRAEEYVPTHIPPQPYSRQFLSQSPPRSPGATIVVSQSPNIPSPACKPSVYQPPSGQFFTNLKGHIIQRCVGIGHYQTSFSTQFAFAVPGC